jgi:hypothetical protein
VNLKNTVAVSFHLKVLMLLFQTLVIAGTRGLASLSLGKKRGALAAISSLSWDFQRGFGLSSFHIVSSDQVKAVCRNDTLLIVKKVRE